MVGSRWKPLGLTAVVFFCRFYAIISKSQSLRKINECFENKSVLIVDEEYTGILWNWNFSQSNSMMNTCIVSINASQKIQNGGFVMSKENKSYIIHLKNNSMKSYRLTVLAAMGNETCSLTGWLPKHPELPSPPLRVSVPQNPTQFIGNANAIKIGDLDTCKIGSTTNISSISKCCNIFLITEELCQTATYHHMYCKEQNETTSIIRINTTTFESKCFTCRNPILKPAMNITIPINGNLSIADSAVFLMDYYLYTLLKEMGNETSAAISMGTTKGILIRTKYQADLDKKDIGIGESGVNIIENINAVEEEISTSVKFPKEALNKSLSNPDPFLGIFLFPNMTKDEKNSIILNNAVLAIEMGVNISNLTERINITFRYSNTNDIKVSCNSWNGSGNRPSWTTDGCDTMEKNGSLTCQCNHLTFFAILMTSPGVNISSSDLKSLTYITYIGCSLSMSFLGIALFIHFLLRRAKSSQATKILMNLFLAMFLLNLTFLANEWIANMGNVIACQFLAAVMHYSMLSTFTWFAVEGFHLCLQLVKAFNITIRKYILKVCITGWALPALVVIILWSLGKYGEQNIYSDMVKPVKMCWINDNSVHYIVNIGYYALVFLFTLTVFIVILRRLLHLFKTKKSLPKQSSGKIDIFTIMGLCGLLGITWGFAFFSYGALKIPSFYIFSILNSFQGFFLFVYYYKTNKIVGEDADNSFSKTSKDTLKSTSNPYFIEDLKNLR